MLATLDTLLGSGGVQVVVIENLHLNPHGQMINRSRKQAPNLAASPGAARGKCCEAGVPAVSSVVGS